MGEDCAASTLRCGHTPGGSLHWGQSDEGSILAERGTGSNLVVQVTSDPVSTAGGSLSTLSCVTSGFCAATAAPDTTPASPLPLADVRQANHWTASPPQEGVLQDVSCTSASFCLALPIDADAERWNGTGWSEVPDPDHYFPSQATGLASISCTSATVCTAVGSTDRTFIVPLVEGRG